MLTATLEPTKTGASLSPWMIPQDHEITKTDFKKKTWRHQSFTTHPLQQVDQGWKKHGFVLGLSGPLLPPNLIFHVFILWHLTLLSGFSLVESQGDQLNGFTSTQRE